MSFKYTLQRLFRRTGFELIRLETARRQTLAPHLVEIFDRFAISCVLDVGANTGEYRDFLRHKVGYKKRIISFEPVHAVFNVLAHHCQSDPNWQVFNFALGPANTTAEINVMKMSTFSSFLTPDPTNAPAFMDKNVVAAISSESMMFENKSWYVDMSDCAAAL